MWSANFILLEKDFLFSCSLVYTKYFTLSWKQIIEYANEKHKPILFITDDINKEDWCVQAKNKRIERPKEDLIREIQNEAGVDFWMYSFSQFLYEIKEEYSYMLSEEVYREVEEVEISQENIEGSITKYSSLDDEEIKTRALLLVKDIRELLADYSNNRHFFFLHTNDIENQDLVNNYKGDVYNANRVMEIYNSLHKVQAIMLKEEILKRIEKPALPRDDFTDDMYKRPTNPLGLHEVVDDLEMLTYYL